jgi:pimeloyl-ACP methyl ester carboxylesterase
MFNILKRKESLPHVVFIHGANATSRSFNYIIERCGITDYSYLNYSSGEGFKHNLAAMREDLKDRKDFFIVAHSLGGIYSLFLQEEFNVKGVVSIATPFKGSRTAEWARMFVPYYKLFHDVGPRATPIVESLKTTIRVPWLQIVSTKGNVPWHFGENDGVVTLKSMTCRKDVEYEFVNYNHYEILISNEVADLVKDQLNKHC